MAGIYIHIPFCKKACTYCDFHFSTTFEKYREDMISCICKELDLRKEYIGKEKVSTIYFGGGTPSLLSYSEVYTILRHIDKIYEVVDNPEITLEANPDDINTIHLADWKDAGVNRLSIGVQSFRQEDLDWMNRAHSAEEGKTAILKAREYSFELSIDLIYGLPNLSIEDWKKNIEELIKLKPEHISAYCLTVEEGTVLNKWVETAKISLPNNEIQSEQFLILLDTLSENGYDQYEISNFCRDNKFSKHNTNYWRGIKYLGVGPSAHSFDGVSRSWNIANNTKYILEIKANRTCFETEILSATDQFNELLMTGLRTKWGVNLLQLESLHSLTEEFESILNQYLEAEFVIKKDNNITLTAKGKLIADRIASELFIVNDN